MVHPAPFAASQELAGDADLDGFPDIDSCWVPAAGHPKLFGDRCLDETYAKIEGIGGVDLLILHTAALFHDLGFVELRVGHEVAG